MAIVKPQDFIDKYELSVGMYSTNKLTAYITKYTERYLVNLMGAKMFNEFETDLLNDVPRSPNFLEIFNPFNKDCDGLNLGGAYYGYRLNQILESDGTKEMLLASYIGNLFAPCLVRVKISTCCQSPSLINFVTIAGLVLASHRKAR